MTASFNQIAETWRAAAIPSFIQGAIVLALVALTLPVWRRATPQWRYALLSIALVKFALPPIAAPTLSLFGAAGWEAPPLTMETPDRLGVSAASNESDASDVSDESDGSDVSDGSDGSDALQRIETAGSPQAAPPPNKLPTLAAAPIAVSPVAGPPRPGLTVAGWAFGAQLLGSLALAAFVLLQSIRLRRRVGEARRLLRGGLFDLAESIRARIGLRRAPELRAHPTLQSPQAGGLFRPFVLLPQWMNEASEEDRRALLAHELLHLKRRDPWVNWFQIAVQTWLWWNPLVWLLNRRIRVERELCVDDAVLARGLAAGEGYSRALVDVAERLTRRDGALEALGMADSFLPVRRRVARALAVGIRRSPRLSILSIVALAAVAAFVLPGARTPQADAFDDTASPLEASLTPKPTPSPSPSPRPASRNPFASPTPTPIATPPSNRVLIPNLERGGADGIDGVFDLATGRFDRYTGRMESLERLHELGRGDIAYNWDDGSPPDKRGIMLLRGAKLFEVDAGTVTPRPQLSAERDMTGYAVDEPLGTGIIGVSPGVYYYVRFISADARGLTIEYSKASPELVARIGVSPPPFRGEAVTLANLIGRDEGPVLDLASGELVSVRQDANNAFLDRLGKGDIAFIQDDDYRKNDNEPHQGLGALRGATIRLLLGDRPTWLETFDAEGSAAVHRMPPLPARVRVTTAGGDDYDVHLIWADFNALHLTYQRAVERPASNQARFSAELEGGASVEVLGVTRFDAAEAERTGRLSWWKPDGSPTEAPGVLPADVEGSDPIVAFHIRPSSAEFSLRTVDRDRFVRPKAQWESPGERLEVWLAALDYPEDRRFGNLEFRVQAGEPETLWEIPLKDVERNSWLSIDRHGAVKAIVQETPAVQAFTVTISISAAGLEGDDFIFTDIEGGRHVARTIRGGEAQIWLQSTFPLDRAAGLSRVRRSWSTALFRNVSLASGQRAEVEIQIAPPDPPGGAAPEPTQTEPVVSDAGAVAAHYERAAMDRAGLEFKPPAYEGPPVTVTIAFFVKPDGTIDRPRVAESSGREDLDRAALEAVRLTGKLSPAPRSLAPELEPVEVSLVFRIGG